ncbi:RDD family protein [Paenibacillus pasadenensis]|nr:RDD family protein [Paenibacillus pasadenensis]
MTALLFLLGWRFMFSLDHTDESFYLLERLFYYLTGMGLVLVIFKDSYAGRSFGKRIMKLAIKDSNDFGKRPSSWRRIARNITLIFWPLDFIIMLITGTRIGEKWTKTWVISVD